MTAQNEHKKIGDTFFVSPIFDKSALDSTYSSVVVLTTPIYK